MKKLPLKKTWQQFVPGESRGCDLEEGLHDGHDRCLTQRTNERASSPSVGRSLFEPFSTPVTRSLTWWWTRRSPPPPSGRPRSPRPSRSRNGAEGLPVVKTAFSSDQSCGCCHWESGPEGPTRPTRPELASSRVVHCTPPLGTDRHPSYRQQYMQFYLLEIQTVYKKNLQNLESTSTILNRAKLFSGSP